MILIIIFGFYFKKNYIGSDDFHASFLIYCFVCIVCQAANYIVMLNKKFDKDIKVLNTLIIMMTINVISILCIKLLKILTLIDKNDIYTSEKIVIYIVGLTVMEIIAYIVFIFKETPNYFEKVGAISMVGCSILIFIL